MALTAQQQLDIRYFAGYPDPSSDVVLDDSRDFAYGWVSPGVWATLTHLLNNMRPEVETTLTTSFLPQLATLRDAIPNAGAHWPRNNFPRSNPRAKALTSFSFSPASAAAPAAASARFSPAPRARRVRWYSRLCRCRLSAKAIAAKRRRRRRWNI